MTQLRYSDRYQQQFLAALKTLALVRRLALPVLVQMTQVNVGA